MGGPSSPSRDQTWTPVVEAQHPNYWMVREVPLIFIYLFLLEYFRPEGKLNQFSNIY